MTAEPDTSIADAVVLAVSELPDRTSPDEWPDAMLVTGEELREIIMTELRHSEATPADAGEDDLVERCDWWANYLSVWDHPKAAMVLADVKAEILSLRAQLEEARWKLPSIRDAFMEGRYSCSGTHRHNADRAWEMYSRRFRAFSEIEP